MNGTAAATARVADGRMRRLLVRMNATLFHCLGAALLIECAHLAGQERGAEGGGRAMAQSDERVRWTALRDYARSVWPEFAWDAACAAISGGCAAALQHDSGTSRGSCASVAAVFYRELSSVADDPVLRGRLAASAGIEQPLMASGSVHAPRRFFGMLAQRLGTPRQARERRDRLLRRAFDLLQQHWVDAPPFRRLGCDEFMRRASELLAMQSGATRTRCRTLLGPDMLAAVAARLPADRSLPRVAMLR